MPDHSSVSQEDSTFRYRNISVIIYAIIILAAAVNAYRKPLLNFDRFQYAAAVASLHTNDPVQIGQEALQVAPKGDYPHTPVTDNWIRHPETLAQQIPFYMVKPAYIFALRYLGLTLVSPLGYLLTCIVLLVWLRNPWYSLALAMLPDMVLAARDITPDIVSTGLILGSCLLFARGKNIAAFILVLFSITFRTDNLFFLTPLVIVACFARAIRLRQGVLWVALGIATVVLVDIYAKSYGWMALIRRNFYGPEAAVSHLHIGVAEFLRLEVLGFRGTIGLDVSLWLLLSYFAWRKSPSVRKWLFICAFYVIAHLLAFPYPQGRYFLPVFLLIGISFIQAFRRGTNEPILNERAAEVSMVL